MFDHLRHIQNAVLYHKKTVLNPFRLASLASAWWRNEVAFIQRSHRLSNILGVEPKCLDELFEEAGLSESNYETSQNSEKVLSVKELEDRLQIAVDNEKYEVAAKIRDQINELKE